MIPSDGKTGGFFFLLAAAMDATDGFFLTVYFSLITVKSEIGCVCTEGRHFNHFIKLVLLFKLNSLRFKLRFSIRDTALLTNDIED